MSITYGILLFLSVPTVFLVIFYGSLYLLSKSVERREKDPYFNREYMKPKTTTFHGLSSFRKLVCGKITLVEYRKARTDTETKDLK